jgi:hypothetical protein
MKQRAMIIVAFVTCLWTACMFFPGHGEKQVVVRLDNVEIFCTMPEKGYVVSERQETDDKASVTYECPTV